MMLKLFAAKLCHQRLSILYNYFDGPTKLFSDLYLAKFLNISTKSFSSMYVMSSFKINLHESTQIISKFLDKNLSVYD